MQDLISLHKDFEMYSVCLRKPLEGFRQWIEIFIFKFLEISLLLLCRQLAIGKGGRETAGAVVVFQIAHDNWKLGQGGSGEGCRKA